MRNKPRLSPSMTISQFDNGYWYATELRDFAKTLGIIAAAKLRKDELEKAIKTFLSTGRLESPAKRAVERRSERDTVVGLTLDLPVGTYTNDPETKEFLEREALKLAPGFRRKSGSRYRLNRWRERQLAAGVRLTYGDLVSEYVRLNRPDTSFARVPHGRYINFLSDYLAKEKDATREDAIAAWHALKTMDIPKTYAAWRQAVARE